MRLKTICLDDYDSLIEKIKRLQQQDQTEFLEEVQQNYLSNTLSKEVCVIRQNNELLGNDEKKPPLFLFLKNGSQYYQNFKEKEESWLNCKEQLHFLYLMKKANRDKVLSEQGPVEAKKYLDEFYFPEKMQQKYACYLHFIKLAWSNKKDASEIIQIIIDHMSEVERDNYVKGWNPIDSFFGFYGYYADLSSRIDNLTMHDSSTTLDNLRTISYKVYIKVYEQTGELCFHRESLFASILQGGSDKVFSEALSLFASIRDDHDDALEALQQKLEPLSSLYQKTYSRGRSDPLIIIEKLLTKVFELESESLIIFVLDFFNKKLSFFGENVPSLLCKCCKPEKVFPLEALQWLHKNGNYSKPIDFSPLLLEAPSIFKNFPEITFWLTKANLVCFGSDYGNSRGNFLHVFLRLHHCDPSLLSLVRSVCQSHSWLLKACREDKWTPIHSFCYIEIHKSPSSLISYEQVKELTQLLYDQNADFYQRCDSDLRAFFDYKKELYHPRPIDLLLFKNSADYILENTYRAAIKSALLKAQRIPLFDKEKGCHQELEWFINLKVKISDLVQIFGIKNKEELFELNELLPKDYHEQVACNPNVELDNNLSSMTENQEHLFTTSKIKSDVEKKQSFNPFGRSRI